MANRFHHTMNSLHLKLKFEIEKPETTPNGLSLSVLDFKVTIAEDDGSSFEFYKKPAKKPMFVHHQSAIPKKAKINQEYSTEPFCKITVLQGHHELAGNLSTGIEILLAICCYRKLAWSVFTKLFYGWKN